MIPFPWEFVLKIRSFRNSNFRQQAGLPLLQAARPLYRALIAKGYAVPYQKRSQSRFHDNEWAVQWLGEGLAGLYLEKEEHVRWPQEGMSQRDMELVLSSIDRNHYCCGPATT